MPGHDIQTGPCVKCDSLYVDTWTFYNDKGETVCIHAECIDCGHTEHNAVMKTP